MKVSRRTISSRFALCAAFWAIWLTVFCVTDALAQRRPPPRGTNQAQSGGQSVASPQVRDAASGPRDERPAQSSSGRGSLAEQPQRSGGLHPGESAHYAHEGVASVPQVELDYESMPEAAYETIDVLNMRGADLRDVLRGIGEERGINLIVDDNVRQRVTVRLSNLSVIDAVRFLAEEHGLSLKQQGPIFRLFVPPPPEPSPPAPPRVEYGTDGTITLDLSDDPLRAVMRRVSEESGINIMIERGTDGQLTGYLQDVPLEEGLTALLENNGFRLRQREGIYIIERDFEPRSGDIPQGAPAQRGRAMWVNVKDGTVDIQARTAPIEGVLREVAGQMKLNLVTYQVPEGNITASVSGISLDEAFTLLLKGSDITYREVEGTYYIGHKETSGIATTKLVKLDHMKAEGIPGLLPPSLKGSATVQVIPEYNAVMITGTNDVIDQLEEAIATLDQPTPLILIEALVVDFNTTDLFELGFEFGQDSERSKAAEQKGYTFGQDGFELEGENHRGNFYLDKLKPIADNFGIRNIGELPDDFFFKLRALSQEGKVEIRSRPQIATLSGHSASLRIGTTQYFILRKETPIQTPGGGVVIQETERFEQIEANVSLEVTPWVTASGEVTAEIRPEFSTPVGSFQPDIPPTINSRVFESTVRLKDGETIILGGLIQEDKVVSYNKVPILGSIPLLGQLFRSRSHDRGSSELIVYLTPRIFYGSEDEPQKWEDLREELDLEEPR